MRLATPATFPCVLVASFSWCFGGNNLFKCFRRDGPSLHPAGVQPEATVVLMESCKRSMDVKSSGVWDPRPSRYGDVAVILSIRPRLWLTAAAMASLNAAGVLAFVPGYLVAVRQCMMSSGPACFFVE
ncbi:hypothetical protein BD779DRAFT_1208494 [Infundibulicybe gibba]|nr:hypothetical protein BD779DRAFT_1208494 [Infundibulicybe gibba]